MINKIKEALRQEYKSRLELDDERLDGVAAFAATFVTDEAKIEEFVKNTATFTMLKSYQSVVDKDRAKRKPQEPNPQPSQPTKDPIQPQEPTIQQPQDMAKIIADAVATAIKPISEELAKFKGEQNAKAALEAAKTQFFGKDYVKKYGDEANDAWELANEFYKFNPEWTAEQINEAAMSRFNKAVAKKGVDTTKPFEGNKGGEDKKPDFSSFDRAATELGWKSE